MRERVDQIVDQGAARAANLAVFPANGINFPRHVAEQRGDFVGVKAGSVDHAARFDGFVLRVLFITDTKTDANAARARFDRNYFLALNDVRALIGGKAAVGWD